MTSSLCVSSALLSPAASPEPAPAAPTVPVMSVMDAPAELVDHTHDAKMNLEAPGRTVAIARPPYRGTGLFAAAGALYASALAFQAFDLWLCQCATGFVERGFLGAGLVLAPIGASLRATSDAWHDAALRRPPRRTRAMLYGGAALTVLGIAGTIANEIMWWQCMEYGTGPYALGDDAWGYCRSILPRLALDASAAATTAGIGMMTWTVRYRRHSRAYAKARLGLRPNFAPGHTGLTLSGRF